MKNPQVKQRIKVKRSGRGYQVGRTYTVVRVDPNDSTLVAVDSEGGEGSWIKWDQCAPATADINWGWLKSHLPAEALELLNGFEGLENLRLRDEIRDRILLQLPNLKERILASQIQIEEENISSGDEASASDETEEFCGQPPF
jgi:hypothetical protein